MKRTGLIILTFFAALVFAACASTATIKFEGNRSVGDSWESAVTPEGIVREVSNSYRIFLPFPGMGGTFTFKFEAIAEGEAEIVLTHYYRGRKTGTAIYAAVVDKNNRLTLTNLGSQGFNMAGELYGTWYAPDEKTAVRFLEDLMQIAVDIEDIETARFFDYATYTVGWDFIEITTIPRFEDSAAFTNTIGYSLSKSYDQKTDYLSLLDSYGFIAGEYTKLETPQ
jgi:predicted secreted protein